MKLFRIFQHFMLVLTLWSASGNHATAASAINEPPLLAPMVKSGKLDPWFQRLPKTPLVSDMLDRKRTLGQYGGQIRTLISKARDLRYLTVLGYTRLVGYDEFLSLGPDILEKFDVQGGRIFTFTLREGHRWSDGKHFTTEDFRFYWEDVALNRELNPSGPPDIFLVNGELPKVEIFDSRTIRYSWSQPNPRFLPALAAPRPYWIYSPAHYLKQFHIKYGDRKTIDRLVEEVQMSSWAELYNKLDDPYEASNPDLPTLDPWIIVTRAPAQQFIFERNPYFHRVDPEGRQLPYIDRLVAEVASAGLVAAKTNAGDTDLQFKGLMTSDIPTLKEGEAMHDYRTLAWPIARGSAFALYPNLTTNDLVWRSVVRDVRFRRALSLAIDRHTLNNALWFRLGIEGGDTVMPSSPLYSEEDRKKWSDFNPALANVLLDEMGLDKRDSAGNRLLPDGRIAELVVEVAGDSHDIIDALEITSEFWRDIGIKMVIKAEDQNALNNRSFAGMSVMIASVGLDNAMPTAETPPSELAPVRQDHMSWPKWGQYTETSGRSGEKINIPEAEELLALYGKWMKAETLSDKTAIWREMLSIHADQQFVIGTVQGALQPIVVSRNLHNIPRKAVFSWEPTAMLGMYHADEFYYAPENPQTGQTP